MILVLISFFSFFFTIKGFKGHAKKSSMIGKPEAHIYFLGLMKKMHYFFEIKLFYLNLCIKESVLKFAEE